MGSRRFVLLQGGQSAVMPLDDDQPLLSSRLCVMHDCPRPPETERVLRLGGREVVAQVCAAHADSVQGRTA